MKNREAPIDIQSRRTGRRNLADQIETVMVVALAGLVVLKGAPVVGSIASAIGGMMWAVARVLAS